MHEPASEPLGGATPELLEDVVDVCIVEAELLGEAMGLLSEVFVDREGCALLLRQSGQLVFERERLRAHSGRIASGRAELPALPGSQGCTAAARHHD